MANTIEELIAELSSANPTISDLVNGEEVVLSRQERDARIRELAEQMRVSQLRAEAADAERAEVLALEPILQKLDNDQSPTAAELRVALRPLIRARLRGLR